MIKSIFDKSVEPTYMTADKIISRIREELDKIYEKYKGHPLIEEDDLLEGFEDIISDYYEDISLM